MCGVLRGGKAPAAVDPYSNTGIDSVIAPTMLPRLLQHDGVGVDQRHVGREESHVSDLDMQPGSFEQLPEQRDIRCCDRGTTLVVAAQKGDVVRIRGEDSRICLGIACGPAFYLLI